ncbi:MAG: hypothetical protein ACN6P8_25330, partial [Achromobacter piechaudii]
MTSSPKTRRRRATGSTASATRSTRAGSCTACTPEGCAMDEDPYDATDPSDPPATLPGYAELQCQSNFSFLQGASHPEELVARAADLGYAALA